MVHVESASRDHRGARARPIRVLARRVPNARRLGGHARARLRREFGWSRSVLADAFSIFSLVHGAANPVLGWIGDRIGPRRLIMAGGVLLAVALWADSLIASRWHLYATFGVLTAAGVSTAGWTPAVMLVQRQFRLRLGLALGITGSGIGLGIFLVVPICQAMIDALGWRAAFRVLAVVVAAWMRVGNSHPLRRRSPRPTPPAP